MAAKRGQSSFLKINALKDVKSRSIENRGGKLALVGAIPFCVEYPGARFEDKFRSANQMDGISIVDGGKMADS